MACVFSCNPTDHSGVQTTHFALDPVEFTIPYECQDFERCMYPLDIVPFLSNATGIARIALGIYLFAQSIVLFPVALTLDILTCGTVGFTRKNIESLNYGLYNIFVGSMVQIPVMGNIIAYGLHQNIKHILYNPR